MGSVPDNPGLQPAPQTGLESSSLQRLNGSFSGTRCLARYCRPGENERSAISYF
jgi:hypothetical protein